MQKIDETRVLLGGFPNNGPPQMPSIVLLLCEHHTLTNMRARFLKNSYPDLSERISCRSYKTEETDRQRDTHHSQFFMTAIWKDSGKEIVYMGYYGNDTSRLWRGVGESLACTFI